MTDQAEIQLISFEQFKIAYAEVGGIHAFLHVTNTGGEALINFAPSTEIAREGALARCGGKPITTYPLYDLLSAEKTFLNVLPQSRHASAGCPIFM